MNVDIEIMKEIFEKQKEYHKYIKDHQSNVLKCYTKLMQYKSPVIHELFIDDDTLIEDVCSRCMKHDKSKLSYDEFEPYRKHFYPINEEEKENSKELFEKACNFHYMRNDHHWQHRVNTDTLNKPACIENIIDWMAMGITHGDTAYEYYNANKDTIQLNEAERQYMESILNAMEEEDRDNR